MVDDFEKKAADLSFDLTKQFLTLAFGGIAFVVGLSFSTPGIISALMLWLVISAFGGSALLGLLFLMCGVSQLGQKTFDVYSSTLRVLSVLQIVTMLIGTIFLGVLVKNHRTQAEHNRTFEVRTDASHSVTYPLDPDKNVTVEIDGGKLKVTTSK